MELEEIFWNSGRSPSLLRPLGRARAPSIPARIRLLSKQRLEVREASGIVILGRGRFAVVDDERGLYQVDDEGTQRVLSARTHRVLRDLEGACEAPGGDSLLVLAESSGRIVRVTLDSSGNVDGEALPEVLGTFPDIGRKRNKGWEGLDFLPGSCCPDGADRLVAVHEGSPRRIACFSLPALEPELLLRVPEEVEDLAQDLSDLAFDPSSGHLFVLSDESATLLELRLVASSTETPRGAPEPVEARTGLSHGALEPLAVHALPVHRKEKAEGLDFAPDGTLWLATDGRSRLYHLGLAREGPPR